MKDDRYQKNGGNTRFLILILLVTLAVIAGGVSFGYGLLGRIRDEGTAAVPETEAEMGNSANLTVDARSDTDSDAEASDSQTDGMSAGRLPDITEIVKDAMPSVVSITNKSVQEVTYMFRGTMEIESESSGSGIIIGQSDTELLIATNYHVVENPSTLTVCFSVEAEDEEDAIAEAVVKGTDEENDLAVISVNVESIPEEIQGQIVIAQLGSSGDLVVGEPAIAIGNALGYGQSVTLGIISALNRSVEVEGAIHDYIQTDAAINSGNSGGALLNMDGEVIGINSAKVSSSGVEGMGYAIPIDDARPILSELMDRETRIRVEEEERGYLGVYTQDISEEARSLYDIPNGVYISYVVSESPAEDAGLQRGDIISAMDNVNVTSSEGFEELLEYYRAGETVTIDILRADMGNYASQTVKVTFSEQPEDDGGAYSGNNTPPFRGMWPSN
ncbi:MAG: trypsin-like peptidase domain-containing protein [Lachnospiraceae bacterium]|nr:trypsin-like peptidase domain-containing protein [Lachnospiraceae bacterium]